MIIATPRARADARAAQLCALNAGIQLVWGAILAVSLQARSIELAGSDGVKAYAFVAGVGAAVATIVQLVAGPLSDRIVARGGTRRAFFALGIGFAIPAIVWLYLAPTFAQFALAFFALEIAMNVAGGPYQAIIPDFVQVDRRGLASSWMSAYQSLGNAVGVVIAGLVHDPRAVALAIVVPLAGTAIVTIAHVRGRRPAFVARDADAPRVSLSGPLAWLLVSRGLINVGFFTLLGFLLFFVRDSLGFRGPDVTTWTGVLFLDFTLASVVGAVLFARATDRYDKRAVVTITASGVALSLAVLACANSLAPAFVAATLAGIAWGGFVTADWALATSLLPGAVMATAMGIWNIATALPQVIAAPLGGAIVQFGDRYGAGVGARVAIGSAILEFLAGAALIWRLPKA
jgi:MFS family permease